MASITTERIRLDFKSKDTTNRILALLFSWADSLSPTRHEQIFPVGNVVALGKDRVSLKHSSTTIPRTAASTVTAHPGHR